MSSGGGDLASLTEDERRALRGSKFAPLSSSTIPPSSSSSQSKHHHHLHNHQARLAHPGGPMTTNKAAALAKFLERKLQQPGGLESIKPELLELAVKDAKEAVNANGSSGRIVRHVSSFDDSFESEDCREKDDQDITDKTKLKKKNKKKRKGGDAVEKTNPKKKKVKLQKPDRFKSKKQKQKQM